MQHWLRDGRWFVDAGARRSGSAAVLLVLASERGEPNHRTLGVVGSKRHFEEVPIGAARANPSLMTEKPDSYAQPARCS
jgi:hypothetical protein